MEHDLPPVFTSLKSVGGAGAELDLEKSNLELKGISRYAAGVDQRDEGEKYEIVTEFDELQSKGDQVLQEDMKILKQLSKKEKRRLFKKYAQERKSHQKRKKQESISDSESEEEGRHAKRKKKEKHKKKRHKHEQSSHEHSKKHNKSHKHRRKRDESD